MNSYTFNKAPWVILMILLGSSFVSVEIAGNEHHTSQHDHHHGDGHSDDGETTPSSIGDYDDDSTTSSTTYTSSSAVPAPCDTSSLASKMETLEQKIDSLLSQFSSQLEAKISDLKSSIPQPSPASSGGNENSNGGSKVQESFEACVAALSSNNIADAVSQWENIERGTYGPTAKATLLKDILYLAYGKSKAGVIRFIQELINDPSKKFLPSAFDLLQEAMKLNSDNLFSLGIVIRKELGETSSLYLRLPSSVQLVASEKTISLSFNCKTLGKKLEVFVKDEESTRVREYWPVVASSHMSVNHTKGAIWSFVPNSHGNFHVKNHFFGDLLWIEPNYQNLRTVDESLRNRNGTEFSLSFNSDDDTVLIHSVFYKENVIEGYHTRSTRETARPLRVGKEEAAIRFSVEPAPAAR